MKRMLCAVFFLMTSLLVDMDVVFAARSAIVTWVANFEPDIAGYHVYYGTSSGEYVDFVTVFDLEDNPSPERSCVISGLGEEESYFFAVKAFDFAGQESDFSDEVRLWSVVYFSGDDGTVGSWAVTDNVPVGASVMPYLDPYGNYMVEFSGSGTDNCFRLPLDGGPNQFVVQWTQKFSEPFLLYLEVVTSIGNYMIMYKPIDTPIGVYKTYPLIGLGADSTDCTERTFVRDVRADFATLYPAATVQSVRAMHVKVGSGLMDDVRLRSD